MLKADRGSNGMPIYMEHSMRESYCVVMEKRELI